MKQVWVKVDPWDKDLVCAALEAGADAVVVPEGRSSEEVRQLGLIKTVAADGDLVPGRDVVEVEITDKAAEELAAAVGQGRLVIAKTTDWSVIPWENLIASGARIIAQVDCVEDACTAATTLETGTEGVLLVTTDVSEIKRAVSMLKSEAERVQLSEAEVTCVVPVGMGDRVCVDTCSNMGIGEGMLVGTSSAAMFLVHAESVENPYVAPRPFRVNAGPVHAYVQVPGEKTRYLSEIASGDPALIVRHDGTTRTTVVGRAKVERRPLLMVKAVAGGSEVSTILQNAETIRLVTPNGQPVSVVELRPGMKVLVMLGEAGRHFGMQIQETIQEK